MAEVTVYCANTDHARRTPAVSRMSWPDGRFKPTTGCVGCTKWMVDDAIREGLTIIVEPVDDADPTFQEVGNLRRRVEELRAEVERLRATEQRVRDLHSERKIREHDPITGDATENWLPSICTACSDPDLFEALDAGELIEAYEGVMWPCPTVRVINGGEPGE